jgi:purine-cytosine permease-like protein
VEHRGIEIIPEEDRRLTLRDLGLMWSGTIFSVSYVVYGAFVVFMGLSFVQSVLVILVGCLTFALVGAYSVQGPRTGTSTFVISRAAFGPKGGRALSLFNWVTVVGYEVITASITVLAILALLAHWGVHAGVAVKLLTIVLVALVQGTLPFLGHAAITRFLRVLVVPFVVLFVILAFLVGGKIHLSNYHAHGGWVQLSLAFALVAAVGGLGWANTGNDYSRYLPSGVSRAKTIAVVSLGSGVPAFLLMVLGAATATAVEGAGDPISGLPGALPGWFIVPYLLGIAIQLIASNSLNLYSSGLTLQAAGLRIKRYHAILLDSAICLAVTIGVIFSSRFNTLVSDFLLFTILWLTAWAGVFGADALLRRGRYDQAALFAGRGGLYYGHRGFNVAGMIAVALGIAASALWLNTSVYKGPITTATGGSDMSVFMGLIVSAAAYALLHRVGVRRSRQRTVSI